MVIPIIILFILGTFFGSFMSVVIHRIHKEKRGIFFGKSECPYCNEKLKIINLIPILSYIIQRGKCGKCKKKIGLHYLFLELTTGFIFGVLFLKYPFMQIVSNGNLIIFQEPFLIYLYLAILSVLLIGIFFFDLLYMEIPEIFALPAIALVLVVNLFLEQPGIISMGIGFLLALILLGLQVYMSGEKWLGSGDVRIGIIMGLFFGWQFFLVSIIIAYILGSIVSIVLVVSKKVTRKSKIAFAPFMITSMYITIFFGDFIMDLYLKTLL